MTGHVFHPGHHELHGITVVVDAGPRTFVGRFDRVEEGMVQLLDVAVHDAAAAPREEFLQKSHKFGIRVDLKHLALPEAEVRSLVPLAELTA
ncbi:MAG: hypothetical protein ACREL4_08875 [Gemmatimonadales bacterium]